MDANMLVFQLIAGVLFCLLVSGWLFFAGNNQCRRDIQRNNFHLYFAEYFPVITEHEGGIMELNEFASRTEIMQAGGSDAVCQRVRKHDKRYPGNEIIDGFDTHLFKIDAHVLCGVVNNR